MTPTHEFDYCWPRSETAFKLPDNLLRLKFTKDNMLVRSLSIPRVFNQPLLASSTPSNLEFVLLPLENYPTFFTRPTYPSPWMLI